MIIGSRLGVVDVVGDDGAAAGDFLAHELRGDFAGDRGAEVLPLVLAAEQGGHLLAHGPAGAQALQVGGRFTFSRMATNSISGVMMPWRA
jgi:hypothetical protein